MILTQLFTASSAFLGTYMGHFVHTSVLYMQYQDMILSVTAGGFLYLSTVVVLPSILTAHAHSHDSSTSAAPAVVHQSIVQIVIDSVGFILGVYMMYIVAKLEEHDHAH